MCSKVEWQANDSKLCVCVELKAYCKRLANTKPVQLLFLDLRCWVYRTNAAMSRTFLFYKSALQRLEKDILYSINYKCASDMQIKGHLQLTCIYWGENGSISVSAVVIGNRWKRSIYPSSNLLPRKGLWGTEGTSTLKFLDANESGVLSELFHAWAKVGEYCISVFYFFRRYLMCSTPRTVVRTPHHW